MSAFHIDGLCHLGGDELVFPEGGTVPLLVFYTGCDVKCGDVRLSRAPSGINAVGDIDLSFISPTLTAHQLRGIFPSLAITYQLASKMVLNACLCAFPKPDVPLYKITWTPPC